MLRWNGIKYNSFKIVSINSATYFQGTILFINYLPLLSPQFSPSRASFVKALLSLRPIGDHIDAALVHYGDTTQGTGHLVHDLGIGVALGLHVRPLQDGLAQAAELHSVGSEDGLGVAADQAWGVDQVPEAVGVNDQGQVSRLHLK